MTDNVFQNRAEMIIRKLDEYSSGKIINKEDLTRIINRSFNNEKENLLSDIAFSAKYIQGLMKIIQNRDSDIDEEYFSKIKKELSENLEKVKSNLSDIVGKENSFISNIFEEKYLGMTQVCLQNLTNLCSDLSWLKSYLNEFKKLD